MPLRSSPEPPGSVVLSVEAVVPLPSVVPEEAVVPSLSVDVVLSPLEEEVVTSGFFVVVVSGSLPQATRETATTSIAIAMRSERILFIKILLFKFYHNKGLPYMFKVIIAFFF